MGELYAGPGYQTCSHVACKWPAVASLGFDYETMVAWLEDLASESHPSTYQLCSVHAERFSPPRGWKSEDRRRLPEPRFTDRTVEEAPQAPAPTDEDSPFLATGLNGLE